MKPFTIEESALRHPMRWNKNSLNEERVERREEGQKKKEKTTILKTKYNGQKYSAAQTLHNYTKNYRHSA